MNMRIEAIPANIDAEQAMLGAILMNNDALAAVPPSFDVEHFFEEVHRHIYDAICRGRAFGKSMNPVTVRSFMSPEFASAKVGEKTVFRISELALWCCRLDQRGSGLRRRHQPNTTIGARLWPLATMPQGQGSRRKMSWSHRPDQRMPGSIQRHHRIDRSPQ